MTPPEIEALLDHRVVICVGPGGVGKTTASALLGLLAAAAGRRALCVTVDPSERLAQSLGLRRPPAAAGRDDAADRRADIMEETIHRVDNGLDAVIIHGSWVIDRAIARHIPADKWDTIRRGRIYPYMRHTLRGLHELAGMVLVNDLVSMGRWETIIVDTAPSAHAIDFLEMPDRIVQAIRSPAVAMLMGAASLSIPGRKIIGKASSIIVRSVGRLIGLDFLSELSEFLTLNRESLESLCTAAEIIRNDILMGGACIVQVSSTTAQSIDESLLLHKKIKREGFSTHSFVINRVLPFGSSGGEVPAVPSGVQVPEGLLRRLEENFREMSSIAARQETEIARLVEKTPHVKSYFKIPLLDDDVHDLPVLKNLLGRVAVMHSR
jgi:anion-transporting  ArsA/GET3 family ATPase